jgi:branched-chain amino acid transport system permease protein
VFPDLVALGSSWTGGDDGLTGIAPFTLGGDAAGDGLVYEIILVFTLLSWVGVRNLVRSSWGMSLRALRESERAGDAVGLNPFRTKLLVYVASGVPVAIAGWLFAHQSQFIAPQVFGIDLTVLFMAAVLLGGPGTLIGPLIGTALLRVITLWIDPFSKYNTIILGSILVLIWIAFPKGLVPAFEARVAGRRRRGPASISRAPAGTASPAEVAPSRSLAGEALSVHGVAKAFGGNRVLRGVDLAVRPGHVVGLVGPNGSGKTTLVNIITGMIRADAGEVSVNGTGIAGRRPYQISRLGASRSFQVPQLVEDLSVGENIELGLLRGRRPGLAGTLLHLPGFLREERSRARRAVAIAAWLGFDERTTAQPVHSLPLGLKRIVEVGRAVASAPTLVCLDEPAAGLNAEELARLHTCLEQLRSAGFAVLLIEHNLPFVLSVSDEIYLLDAGVVGCHADRVSAGVVPEELRQYLSYVPVGDGMEEMPALVEGGAPR